MTAPEKERRERAGKCRWCDGPVKPWPKSRFAGAILPAALDGFDDKFAPCKACGAHQDPSFRLGPAGLHVYVNPDMSVYAEFGSSPLLAPGRWRRYILGYEPKRPQVTLRGGMSGPPDAAFPVSVMMQDFTADPRGRRAE